MEATTTIKRYNLAPPNEQDVLASLDRLVGEEESNRIWAIACRQANARAGSPSMSIDQLEKALVYLKENKGLASISASSMLVRVKSYRTLSRMNS